jgi:hypothetical protein
MTDPARRGRAKLPAHYAGFLSPFILSIIMTFIVSGISTLRSIGFTPDFFKVWPVAWGMSWAVAFPLLFLVMPVVRWIIATLVEKPEEK